MRSGACMPIPITKRAVQLKTGQQDSRQKEIEEESGVLVRGLGSRLQLFESQSNNFNYKRERNSDTALAVWNSDMAKFGTVQERQIPLKVYAHQRGQRSCEKLVEEQIHNHIKQFTRKLKDDKKMKHRKRFPGNGVSSSISNITREMRGRILKIPDFPAIRNQRNDEQAALTRELILPPQIAWSSALQQVAQAASPSQGKRNSDRNRRKPSNYGFDRSCSDSTIAAPPKRPRRAVDFENFQPPPESVVETVKNIAIQQPEETKTSVIGEVSPLDPRVPPLINQRPTT